MSHGSPNRRRRGDRGGGGHDGPDERWLLTYADMITLLMALFIVMWAISSVNVGKFDELKKSLSEAFSGGTLEGGQSVLEDGREVLEPQGAEVENVKPPEPSPMKPIQQQLEDAAAIAELEALRRVQRAVEAYAKTHGFAGRIKTSIDERGLAIRLMTDEVLFDTGEAVVKSQSLPLLNRIAALLNDGRVPNPIRVEGNTDTVPISTSEFRSNWELSTARATAVLQRLLARGVAPHRLSATGYADQRPVATNGSPHGRSLNRRVELVVLRRYGSGAGS